MTVSSDLAAIDADSTLTPDEKRIARYALKCGSLYNALLPYVAKQWNYQGVTYRLISVATSYKPLGSPLIENVLYVVYTRSDRPGELEERIFSNPLFEVDGVEDLIGAAKLMIGTT